MNEEDVPPKTRVPGFKVLGRVPWGGKKPPNANQRIMVPAHQRDEVLTACEKLVKTGLLVAARMDRDSSVDEHRDVGLIDLLALEAGIRWYRDKTPGETPDQTQTWRKYRTEQRITATDVLHYVCRSTAWLLLEMGVADVPTKFPTNYDAMIVRTEEIAELLRRIPR